MCLFCFSLHLTEKKSNEGDLNSRSRSGTVSTKEADKSRVEYFEYLVLIIVKLRSI